MILLIVTACALVAAIVAFALSASKSITLDPIDPAVEERAVQRSLWHHPKVRRFIRERMDRATAGGFMLTAGFVVVFGATAALGALLALIDDNKQLREIDDRVAEWGSQHATSRAIDVIRFITNFGATWVVLTVLLVVAAADYLRRRNATVFAFVAVVGVGEVLLNNLIKVLVHRERPAVMHLMAAGGYSFPSGHTAAAAAAWASVALIVGRDRSRPVRAALAAGAALIAMTVATSRALLGVHWVSDVLGGLALGWGWFLLVAVAFGGRTQRLGDPVVGVTTAGESESNESSSAGLDRKSRVNA